MEPVKKVWVLFEDGTRSQQAIRAVWITDSRNQQRVLEPDTIAELVDMLEWWRRVRETPVAVCAIAANKRVG